MHAILQELTYDSLRDGAVWPFDRAYLRPPHFHGQVELLLIRSGVATLQLGAHAASVHAGQLCWILPGVPHVMRDFSTDFDMWVVELDADLVGACWNAVVGEPVDAADGALPRAFGGWAAALGEHIAGRGTVDVARPVARDLDELATRVWSATRASEARAGLRALCDLALRVTLASVDARREASLGQLASCLLLASPHFDRPAVAAELGVSEGFLSRRIHHDLGVTFVEHRARTRVVHFLALVNDPRRNLFSAALDAGFGSYSQFHRVFTRVSSSRPSDYFAGGRRRRQLLVAGDLRDPRSGATRELAAQSRQRAPVDA